ncbi:DNA primase [Candidatus Woesebacteria bacterium]|nr:DNA primase [Candidatus Woesebacteria bacterium]
MSQINQVKEATNIIELIGSRVSLQRSGTNFRGLCPFHSEKGPSFFVSETMQRYKCFGCGKTGDVFTFLEEYEGMTFREALESLAQAAGITLTQSAPHTQEDDDRTAILEINDLARAYYHFLLTDHPVGEKARAYLKGRGIQQDSIRQFQIGVALDAWDGLVTYLHDKKKYDLDLIVAAGLAIRGNGGRVYDRFRSRIMFPLKNHRGQTTGFSGRIIDASADKETPKYMNTPETLLYHKSQMLFGFYENLQEIRKEKRVVVVEGEFDVISSTEAHISTVVAIKGSALTQEHVKLLSRSVDQIILSLDADSAGITATKRAIEVIKQSGISREQPLSLNILRIPDGKDPDELSQKDPKRWRELVKHPITAYEFLIQAAFEHNDPQNPDGKLKIMAELTPMLAGIDHAVQFEHYSKSVAEKLGVSLSSVQSDVRRYQRRDTFMSEQKERAAAKEPIVEMTRMLELESYLLFLLTNAPATKRAEYASQLSQLPLETTSIQLIIAALRTSTGDLGAVVKQLPSDMQQTVFEYATNQKYFAALEKINIAKEWAVALKEFAEEKRKISGQKIEAELEELDRVAEKTPEQEARQNELLQQLVLLQSRPKIQ